MQKSTSKGPLYWGIILIVSALLAVPSIILNHSESELGFGIGLLGFAIGYGFFTYFSRPWLAWVGAVLLLIAAFLELHSFLTTHNVFSLIEGLGILAAIIYIGVRFFSRRSKNNRHL